MFAMTGGVLTGAGSSSLSVTVTVVIAPSDTPLVGLVSVTVNVFVGSKIASLVIGMLHITLPFTPSAQLSVAAVAVKSVPAVAVPFTAVQVTLTAPKPPVTVEVRVTGRAKVPTFSLIVCVAAANETTPALPIFNVNAFGVESPNALVALIFKLTEPSTLLLPVILPFELSNDKPAGSAPVNV